MNGVVLNPFLEGVILALLGLGFYVTGHLIGAPDLNVTGQLIIGAGVGYFVHTGVQAKAA